MIRRTVVAGSVIEIDTEKEHLPSAGEKKLLDALWSLTQSSYDSLDYTRQKLKEQQAELKKRQLAVEEQEAVVASWEIKLKDVKRDVAQICNDLGKLGCTLEDIQKKWKDYCAHDVAEWINY